MGTCSLKENSTYEELKPMQGAVLGMLATPGVVANVFAIIIIARLLRHQKVVPNVLVLALAFCDLFGIINVCWPTWLCYAYNGWVGGDSLCYFQGFITLFVSLGSGVLATLLALDRYLSVKAPFFHRENISFRTARRGVAVVFVFSAIIAFMPVLGFGSYVRNLTGTYCTINWFAEEWKDKSFSYFFAFIGFLMIFIVLFCNIHVVVLLIKQRNSKKKLQGMKSRFKHVSKPKKTASERLQQQYQRMMIVISLLFLICWTPFMIRIIGNITGIWCSWSADLQASRLLFLNLVLDPFVYVLARKQYREALYRHCCCCLPCVKKGQKDSIRIKFAYSATLSNQSERNRAQTIIEQIGDNNNPQFRARDELGWHMVSGQQYSTEAQVHEHPDEKDIDEKENARLTIISNKENRKSMAILRDSGKVLPLVTREEVRDALKHLLESGIDNEGLVTEEGSATFFEEVLAILNVAPDGPGKTSNVYDRDQRYSRLEEEKRQGKKRNSKRHSKPEVANKALQVMEYIMAKRQNSDK